MRYSNKPAAMPNTRTSTLCLHTSRAILYTFALVFFANLALSDGARLKRAVMLDMGDMAHPNCRTGTINERNSSTSIILTGTVKKCDKMRPGKYSCKVQVWRVMKGVKFAENLIKVQEEVVMSKTYRKHFTEVYGLGNPAFCGSEVKEDKTRIFFLNRVDDRLVLAASLLHITLKNLENTQNVIKGIPVEEVPKVDEDPCLKILCGFGAKCEASKNGTTTCVCPKVTCGGTPDSSDTFAPVCGSDGVTYPSECRVKAAQCWTQRRIRIVSQRPCSPVEVTDPCENVNCGNMARCAVQDGKAKCQCRSCDKVSTQPICGSDQKTYRSECDMQRTACLNAQSLYVVRRSTCDPCETYNEESKEFQLQCEGSCTVDETGSMTCCDSILCAEDDEMMICGSDGRTYMSRCALQRYACKAGKMITEVSAGSCPTPRETTLVRGSTSIAADSKCPGNCDDSSPEFVTFKKQFEENVNTNLKRQNKEDIDARMLSSFKVEEIRKGSAVLVYSVVMSWSDMPIDEDFTPGQDSLWTFERLHDPARGVLKRAIDSMEVTFVAYQNPADNFLVEEVCGNLQCENGAGCLLSKDTFGGFQYACDCSVVGVSKRLPVTLGCKLANNNRFYENKIAVKHASCSMSTFLTFKNVCLESPKNLCDDLTCPQDGSTCILTNEEASCECITCPEEFDPVCGANERTYKSECELHQDNCLQKANIAVKSKGMCASQCDEVDCRSGGQCEELAQGTALCICPSACVEVFSPVCGSDMKTYDNECQLTIAACNDKKTITVISRKPCEDGVTVPEPDEGSGEPEGSGGEGTDECGCKFGAVCDATIDDEDGRCVCDFKCGSTGRQVCGSDGKTYTNECELLKTQCDTQKSIRVVSNGTCPDSCSKSTFGCCEDGSTAALGVVKAGCPETCHCNEHGSFALTCHPVSGQCDCRPGVGGLKCDQCQPGFWNFRAIAERRTVGCMDCRCQKDGAVRDDCDQMTGQCVCKEGITGVKCSKCADTGDWVSLDGCGKGATPSTQTETSCDQLNCRYGQECVAYKEGMGSFICQCPPLSSCDSYSNGKVCGSNGITYADECQMKVVACREDVVITVQSEGSCEEFVKTLKPVIPPIVTPSTTPEVITITTQPEMMISTSPTAVTPTTGSTTTTTMMTKTTQPDVDEGSGETVNPSETTIDDEDGDMTELSGDGLDLVPTKVTAPDNLSTPESKRNYKVTATIVSVDDNDLVFSTDLKSKDTELYAEYSSAITNKIDQIVAMMPNSKDGVSYVKDIDIEASSKGVVAMFVFAMPDKASMDEVQQFLNANLEEGESFTFIEPDFPHQRPSETFNKSLSDDPTRTKPIKKSVFVRPVLPELPYAEDGEWNVPQFGGTSYMEFEKMSAYGAATIHMRFRTSDSEGLLLYNGQNEGRDFISLTVIGGNVEFRFDTGSGQLSLRSSVPVDDGEWHEVVSRRNRREGMLMVDSESEISGNSNSGTTGLNLDSSLFIGGFVNSEQDKVFKQTGVTKGLTGCISDVKVGVHGNKVLRLSSADDGAQSTYRLAECAPSPCLPSPCKNSAKCFITYQLEEFTYKCDCGPRHYGEKCEHKTTAIACSSNPCHESSTCIEEGDSYKCVCPKSRTGVHCNSLIEDLKLPTEMEPSYMPVFAGDSHIERKSLALVETRLEVEIVFYTFQLEGLLFYNGQKETGKGDFVALNIRDGHLEFMYNLGQGTAVIRSESPVSLNEWHVVRLSRLGRLGDMKLDDSPLIKGESPHQHSQLNLGLPLYIGAIPETVTVPAAAHITTGLMGSIQKFVVNSVSFPRSLMSEDSKSYNVQAFNGHACFRKPCQNSGTCIPDMGTFTCTCAIGFSGELCDIVDDSVEAPMLQDATEQAVYFDGSVGAQYNNQVTRRRNPNEIEEYSKTYRPNDHSIKDNYFEIQVKTTAYHGLVFYDGKPSKRGDYIALAISYGKLHLTFDLGSGQANIESDLLVNDGQWKTIKIIRNEHKASLQVDNALPKHASAPPLTKWLNTVGVLWIGGCDAEQMPPRHRGLPKSFYVGFKGCMRQFNVEGSLLRLREDVLNWPKLSTCQER